MHERFSKVFQASDNVLDLFHQQPQSSTILGLSKVVFP